MARTPVEAVADYYMRQWGRPTKITTLWHGDYRLDVGKWDASTHPWEVNVYATLGACAFPVPGYAANHRFEFLIGLLPEKDEVDQVLVNLGTYSWVHQTPVGPGHTFTWTDKPLWPSTDMHSVAIHQLNDDLMPALEVGGDYDVHVEFLDVTLLYPSELNFKQEHSLEALFEHWARHDVEFINPYRPPEPA